MTRFFLLALSLCAALAAPAVVPGLFKPIDSALNDWRTRFVVQPRPESRIVIVDVDERSIAELGAWPWPRPTIASLLQTLIDDYGVSNIAIDMVFPEPRPNDDVLAAQMIRPQVTGAVVFDLEQRSFSTPQPVLAPVPPLRIQDGAPVISGVPAMANHAGLKSARAGHITPVFDSDGAVRRVPPMICTADATANCRPSLTLAAYAGMVEQPRFSLQSGRGLFAPAWELAVTAGDGAELAAIPLARDGMLVVPYRHARHDWTSVSAVDILNHKPDPALLKGVMVLMGGTALGLTDVIATPLSAVAAGLEPHAEILSALLDNDFAVMPQWDAALDAVLLLPFAAFLAWALRRYDKPIQRAVVFPLWLLLTWLIGVTICLLALREANLLLPMLPIILFPPFALLLILSIELYRAGSERAGIFTLLTAYLPRQVATRLTAFGRASTKVDTTVDASRREITVLFADINGFAGLSEDQSPEIIARLMQRVFSEMAEAVVNHHGTIDKFIGDAIMAFWNAPEDDPDHAHHALAAARDIRRRIIALAPFCIELGFSPISIGIGMETGQALVGNFGPAHRRTFTALGEPVILASRIEALTKTHREPILIGEICATALGLHNLRALGPMQIRGRIHPLTLYVPN